MITAASNGPTVASLGNRKQSSDLPIFWLPRETTEKILALWCCSTVGSALPWFRNLLYDLNNLLRRV